MYELKKSRSFIYIMLLVATGLGYLIIRDYILTIAFGIILGYMFRPLQVRLLKLTRNRKLISTTLSLLIISLMVIIPATLIALISIQQITQILFDVENFLRSSEFSFDAILKLVDDINRSIPYANIELTEERIISSVSSTVQTIGGGLPQFAFRLGGSAITSMVSLIVFFTILSAVLNNYPKLVDTVKKLSPFPDEIDQMYISRVEAMASSMVKGIFIIAIIQGSISALSLSIVGMDYILLWGLIATIMSIVPLGSGFIMIPLGIGMIALGNVWGGVFVITVNVIVVSNIDNILRPQLASPEAHLHPILTLLGFLGGIQLFGFLGVVLGPILMIFIVTTFEVFQRYYSPQLEPQQQSF